MEILESLIGTLVAGGKMLGALDIGFVISWSDFGTFLIYSLNIQFNSFRFNNFFFILHCLINIFKNFFSLSIKVKNEFTTLSLTINSHI